MLSRIDPRRYRIGDGDRGHYVIRHTGFTLCGIDVAKRDIISLAQEDRKNTCKTCSRDLIRMLETDTLPEGYLEGMEYECGSCGIY